MRHALLARLFSSDGNSGLWAAVLPEEPPCASVAFSWYVLSLYTASKLYQVPEAYLVTGASDQLSFHCPRCMRKIEPFEQSGDLVEEFIRGEKRLGEAREGVIISHYRHVHTDYERARKSLRRQMLLPDVKQQMMRDLKAMCTEEARRLAVSDGLLRE